jgi:hypothetical protein
MSILTAVYDLKLAPITFDFGTYLAIIDCYRQLNDHSHINLIIRASEYRRKSQRDFALQAAEKHWRLKNIILDCCELLPSIKNIHLLRLGNEQEHRIDFPEDYSTLELNNERLPYLAKDVYHFFEQGAQPRVLKAPEYAHSLIDKYITTPFITLTLRSSRHFTNRNVDLEDWYMFYRYLKGSGYNVIVVPDQDDVLGSRAHELYDWCTYVPASLDIRLRAALYEKAKLNVCSSNGPTGVMFFSDAPLLMFDQTRGDEYSGKQWKKLTGLSPGENWPWCGAHQKMTWRDSDFHSLVGEFKGFIDNMQ